MQWLTVHLASCHDTPVWWCFDLVCWARCPRLWLFEYQHTS